MKKRIKWILALLTIVLVTLYCNVSLDAEEYTVYSSRLPASFDGLRLTVLTDIHGSRFGEGSQTLLDAVAAARPDYICISGDLADEYTDTAMLPPLLQGLCDIAPTCYVTGNHEFRRKDTEELMQMIADCGVTVLRNDYLLLERQGQTLVLAGAEDPNGHADMETPAELMARIREAVPNDPYIAMVYHRNDALRLWSGLEADLVLSGHGHGGVIRLPFVGGLLGVDRKFFPKNAEGLYTQSRTTLAVSRGLGGVRLWNRPHLPTVVLRAQP